MNSESQASDTVALFELPIVEGPVVSDSGHISMSELPTAKRLEGLYAQATEEGFQAGRAEGLAAAKTEFDEQIAVLTKLCDSLTQPFIDLDEAVVDGVADLAIAIARLLVRRELKSEPGEVVAVVRETIGHLPLANRNARIFLHPEDLTMIEQALSIGDTPSTWHLEADPLLTRGGCIVETETSRIDATVESRIAAVAAQMFGGDRESDR